MSTAQSFERQVADVRRQLAPLLRPRAASLYQRLSCQRCGRPVMHDHRSGLPAPLYCANCSAPLGIVRNELELAA